ncbi:hypothetical protein [Vibrio harveyi]|uniref:hypothetical protein n=1 Tax=Vibrio harveyi TaxID=669 RepID=UPI0002F73E7A|nr:hypothetical protein [Vibrio harveyi]
MNKNKKLTLKDRILMLVSGVPPMPKLTESELAEPPRGITIRFRPEVRKFLDHQSNHLGCSIQDLVSMTMTSIMKASEQPMASDLEIVCTRFRQLFELHGVSTFDIPDLFGDGKLSRSSLLDDRLLVDSLSDEMLRDVCSKFNVQLDWLKGSTDKPIPYTGHYPFYKNIGYVSCRLARYALKGERPKVLFIIQNESAFRVGEVMAEAAKDDSNDKEIPIGVIIEHNLKLGERSVRIYDVLSPERWNYKKCRIQLKTLMLFCQKTGIPFDGVRLNSSNFSPLFYGECFPIEILQNANATHMWYPDTLLWDNKDRNPEHRELGTVFDCYSKDGYEASTRYLYIHEKALKTPWELNDIDAYIDGSFDKEIV